MRPAAIALNYSVKDIYGTTYDRQIIIIIYHENSQLNRLVWGSLTLAPIKGANPSEIPKLLNAYTHPTLFMALQLEVSCMHEHT